MSFVSRVVPGSGGRGLWPFELAMISLFFNFLMWPSGPLAARGVHSWEWWAAVFFPLDQGSSCRRVRCYVMKGARVDG